MISYILRRLSTAIPLVVVVATLTFFLVQLVPGSPAAAILGESASRDQIASLEKELGLDKPVLEQYFTWASNALRGDFGRSYVSGTSVTETLSLALPPTLALAVAATVVTLIIGFVLGMAAAVRGGRLDRVVQWICSLGMSIPNFWMATVLVAVFAINMGLFPSGGYVSPEESVPDWLAHMFLPVLALCIGHLGHIVFQARSACRQALSRDFVRTLQANGVPRRSLLFKHVLRNSSIPVVTVAGLSFVFQLGGVVIIEIIFSYPGLGSLMLRSVQSNDFSVVQGGVMYFSLVVIVVNLAVDLITAALDPRVRVR